MDFENTTVERVMAKTGRKRATSYSFLHDGVKYSIAQFAELLGCTKFPVYKIAQAACEGKIIKHRLETLKYKIDNKIGPKTRIAVREGVIVHENDVMAAGLGRLEAGRNLKKWLYGEIRYDDIFKKGKGVGSPTWPKPGEFGLGPRMTKGELNDKYRGKGTHDELYAGVVLPEGDGFRGCFG